MNFYDSNTSSAFLDMGNTSSALPGMGNSSELIDSLELQIRDDPLNQIVLENEEERLKQIEAFTAMMRENVTKTPVTDKKKVSNRKMKRSNKSQRVGNQSLRAENPNVKKEKPFENVVRVSTQVMDKEQNWEKKFVLEENRYLSVTKFRGDVKIHIRDWFQDHNGILKPTKSGVVLTSNQWEKIKLLIKSVDIVIYGEDMPKV